MTNNLNKILNIKEERLIEFREKYGFTFVFTSQIAIINNEIASIEITPTGIIYKENNEIYFAPLSENNNLENIVEKYVEENKTTLEEEYFHFQQ